MTKTEIATLRNIIRRLEQPNMGCSNGQLESEVMKLNSVKIDCVSRLYTDTWILPALRMLLPEDRNPELAERISR